MLIEILGTGCAKCKQLARNAEEAVKASDIDATVVKVEDIKEIAGRGVLMTPALVIDGKVIASGKVLTPEQILQKIAQ
ncbi:MAG: TM0996/MTH895 family glutaredoxin-like protein [Deltaproteobacteria bacterium]|nr:TM0996/MTH895 family glutaredoxin-like protein [Deltaproteobacteria bacterium]MBW2305757.1 TM0996/MTH895 family glutaredoxin-like protein [Deltaproteobacteria bacterium]